MAASDLARDAAKYAIELLGRTTGEADGILATAAEDYGLNEKVVEAWIKKLEPDYPSSEWRTRLQETAARQAHGAAAERALLAAARTRTHEIWDACLPDGQPDWTYCRDHFLRASGPVLPDTRRKVIQIFSEAGIRFEAQRQDYLREQAAKGKIGP